MYLFKYRYLVPAVALSITLTLAIFGAPSATARQLDDAQIDRYLEETLDDALATLDDQVSRWRERFSELTGGNIVSELIGYQPPTFLVNIADVSSYLYEYTGERKYAETTRDLLVSMNEYRRYFPEAFQTRVEYSDGIPAVNWFRALPVYTEAFMRTQDSGVYREADIEAIRDAVASSADIVFKFPEWGAMNRAMLRAESLMAASIAFPDHPRAATWRKMAEILASDTIRSWEIEDASIYHPIWLHAYVNYLDLAGHDEVFASPMVKYYFDYFVALLTPAGTIPEFGDGHWWMNLSEYVLLLERGAREYGDGTMKWAANRMLESMEVLGSGEALATPSVGVARTLIRRRQWGDANVQPVEPSFGSGDALEEVIAKKLVFRSGWDPDAFYLMLNYKDEGYYSVMQKDYLKQILAVEEEKMHHGQSDENGISLMMKNGAVLLSDGGYRPRAPSGEFGGYRADIFHNRVVVRDERRGIDQPYFDILRNSGAYNESVQTSKIDFQSVEPFEYSRTRISDPRTGYTGDRVLVRDKAEDYVVVVDALQFTESKYYTAAQLWHTRQVVESGDNWYRMRIDSLMGRFANPGDGDLLVVLPKAIDTGVEAEERADQDEQALYQAVSRYFRAGNIETFVAVLVPISRQDDAASIAARFRLTKDDDEGVTVEVDGNTWYGVKADLYRDVLNEDIRPRYNYDSGKINYGPFTTDADFAFVTTRNGRNGTPQYAATNFVRLDFGDTTLFDAPSSQFFQVWGKSDHVGRAKWRMWDNFSGDDF